MTNTNGKGDDYTYGNNHYQYVKLESESINRLSWIAPLAIIISVLIGINTTATIVMYDQFKHSDMNYTLVLNHVIREDAWLQAKGINTQQFGELPDSKQQLERTKP